MDNPKTHGDPPLQEGGRAAARGWLRHAPWIAAAQGLMGALVGTVKDAQGGALRAQSFGSARRL